VNGRVTNAETTANMKGRAGTVGLNGYSGGVYCTHYGPSGWYVDSVIQGTGYDGSATTQFASLPLNGSSFVSSLEAGYPFPFSWLGPTFVLEPQAQITGRRFPSRVPMTAWVPSASVPPQAPPAGWVCAASGRSPEDATARPVSSVWNPDDPANVGPDIDKRSAASTPR
jgi:Autotransporter beta-domain